MWSARRCSASSRRCQQRGAVIAIYGAIYTLAGIMAPLVMGSMIQRAAAPLDGYMTGFTINAVDHGRLRTARPAAAVAQHRARASAGAGGAAKIRVSNMARYRLHCIGASGNSYKLALYLNCAGLDWEPVGVDFAGGQTRDANWRAGMRRDGRGPGARSRRAIHVAVRRDPGLACGDHRQIHAR